MRIKLELDEHTTHRLVEIALAEKRPLSWQLEILVQQAVASYGLPMLRPEPCKGKPTEVQDKRPTTSTSQDRPSGT
jgi:hypothetical protein